MSETILVADDEPVTRRQVGGLLQRWGYDVRAVSDGLEALDVWTTERPRFALVDWVMPGLDGPGLCRRIRSSPGSGGSYLILLTARSTREDVVAGLEAGADDYLVKPFDPAELRARLDVGRRMLDLQRRLAERVHELEEAIARVRTLEGLVPICMYCKNVRNEEEYWERVEQYVTSRSDDRFSHGICPPCFERLEAEGAF